MRFKKLRIFVGIAILIFVLVIGNIIAFGLTHNTNSNNIAAIDTRKSAVNSTLQVIDSSSPNTASSSTSSNTQQQQVQSTPAPVPAPIVYHPTMRTRAS